MKTQILFSTLIFLISCGQPDKSNTSNDTSNTATSDTTSKTSEQKSKNEVVSQPTDNEANNSTDSKNNEYDENYFKKELDGKYGFRTMKLGMPFKEFTNAVFVRQNADGTEKVYTKSDEVMSLGSVEFSLIQYKFYKNVLWCIYVQPKSGKLNEDNFSDMVMQKYGSMTGIGTWQIGQMGISYKMDDINGDAFLFYSLPLGQKFVEEQKSKNKNAVNEL